MTKVVFRVVIVFLCVVATVLIITGLTIERATAESDIIEANAGWEEVGAGSASGGGISNNAGSSLTPTMAIGADGAPIAAWWDDSSGDAEIYVRRWNGSAWVEMGSGSATGGGISNNSGRSAQPSLVIAPDGSPIIAWADDSSDDEEIYVRRWNGGTWVEVGVGSASGGGISNNSTDSYSPRLAITPSGEPVVAWVDGGEIYVRRFNGSSWVEVGSGSASGGGISNTSTGSYRPSIAILPNGDPIVTWYELLSSNNQIYVRRWNGFFWVEMGAGSASGGGISNSSGVWVDSPLVTIDASGAPVIVWRDHGIYIKRWNGSSWSEVGSGSASGSGISNGGGGEPSIAVGPSGALTVSWYGSSGGNAEIFVLSWNGSAWQEMGSGSTTGGGISSTSGNSYNPVITISHSGHAYTTWNDNSNGNYQIYVRRFQAPATPTPTPTITHTQTATWTQTPTIIPSITRTNTPTATWTRTPTVIPSITPTNTPTATKTQNPTPTATRFTNGYDFHVPIVFGNKCFSGPEEREDNDNALQAPGPLCRGAIITGRAEDQYDYFMFETNTLGAITIDVFNLLRPDAQVALLYDEAQIGPVRVAFDSSPLDGLHIEYANGKTGRYYVGIFVEKPEPGDNRTYTLQLAFP